jgi:hypothetical protein
MWLPFGSGVLLCILDQGYGLVPRWIQPVKTPEVIGLDGPEPCLLDKALIAKTLQHRAPGIKVWLVHDLFDA